MRLVDWEGHSSMILRRESFENLISTCMERGYRDRDDMSTII